MASCYHVLKKLEEQISLALKHKNDLQLWAALEAQLSLIQSSINSPIFDTPVAHMAADWEESTHLWKKLHDLCQVERNECNRGSINRAEKIWAEVVELVECAYVVHASLKERELSSTAGPTKTRLNTPSPTTFVK